MLSAPVAAHDLRVYSEFTRIDPFGQIVRADRGSPPREILSPAIPRNAFSGFHLVVSGRPGEPYTLYIGQNPENLLRITLYREIYAEVDGEWIPDGLERVSLPYSGKLDAKPSQSAQGFWMEVWTSGEVPVRRMKLEPQVYLDQRWIRYPMEVRIAKVTVPRESDIRNPRVAPINLPADASARLAFAQMLCQGAAANGETVAQPTVRSLIARDARQDMQLAAGIDAATLSEWLGIQDRNKWCSAYVPNAKGPERFLRVRDRIYAQHGVF